MASSVAADTSKLCLPAISTSASTSALTKADSFAATKETPRTRTEAAPEVKKDPEDCKDVSALRFCANDPDFAVICAFLQKFSKDLGLEVTSFKQLQDWLTDTDAVPPQLRDLHIRLLRKTRKTVHEKSWESALSKFCFTYSAQDAWEVERFGYKQSSLKVKLRILRELLESQFERNGRFRAKIMALSADSLRSQPVGRDRLGHSYWLTQDNDCNLRIYQEHLDEETWQVVATTRDELVNLIARLRGNEVVLPSTDIGVIDEDTSSSNSNSGSLPHEKAQLPNEREESPEEDTKIPNLRIKLNSAGHGRPQIKETPPKDERKPAADGIKLKIKPTPCHIGEKPNELPNQSADNYKEQLEDVKEKRSSNYKADILHKDSAVPKMRQEGSLKKVRPILISQLNHASGTKPFVKKRSSIGCRDGNQPKKMCPIPIESKAFKRTDKLLSRKNDEDKDAESSAIGNKHRRESDTAIENEEHVRAPKLTRGDEAENRSKEKKREDLNKKSEEDDETNTDEGEEEEADEHSTEGVSDDNEEYDENDDYEEEDEEEEEEEAEGKDEAEVSDAIVDPPVIVEGTGLGEECEGGNPLELSAFASGPEVGEAIVEEVLFVFGEGQGANCLVGNEKIKESETSVPSSLSEPKATFFFGEPGCLKLSPMKQTSKDLLKREAEITKELLPSSNAETKLDVGAETQLDAVNNSETNSCESLTPEKQNCSLNNEKSKPNVAETVESYNSMESKELNKSTEKCNDEAMVLEKHEDFGEEKNKQLGEDNGVLDNEESKLLESNSETGKDIKLEDRSIECSSIKDEKIPPAVFKEEEDVPVPDFQTSTSSQEAEQFKANETADVDTESGVAIEPVEKSLSPKPDIESDADYKDAVKANEHKQNEKVESTEELYKERENKGDIKKVETTPISDGGETGNALNENEQKDSSASIQDNSDEVPACRSSILMTKNVPSKNINWTLPNRKRRFGHFGVTPGTQSKNSTSESEVDLHSEEPCLESEVDLQIVGGKRIKMRPKLSNMELRKKVEAQKIAVEGATSSSGEEDPHRLKKSLVCKKQIDDRLLETSYTAEQLKCEKQAVLNNDEAADSLEATNKKSSDTKMSSSSQSPPILPVKQKPSLDEIIEKKLKKNSEYQISTSPTSVVAPKSGSASTFLLLKKSPITKPLKKNLLTQIREGRDEKMPRKRPSSETIVAPLIEPSLPEAPEIVCQDVAINKDDIEIQKPMENVHCSGESLPNCSQPSDIDAAAGENPANTNKFKENEKLKCDEDSKKTETPEKEKTPEKAADLQTVTERRSSRRGGAAVVYTELTQQKRTRGVKNPIEKNAVKKEPVKDINKNGCNPSDVDKKIPIANFETESIAAAPLIPENLKSENVEAPLKGLDNAKSLENTPAINDSNLESDDKAKSLYKVRGVRKKREVDTTNIIETTDTETPVRQSRRIAQQKIREEAERRKLEEIALRTMKQELKKKKKAEKEAYSVVAEPSEQSSSEASEVEMKKKTKKTPGKDGWSSGSEEQEDPEEEDEEPPQYETDPSSPLFKSDHEFSPESDLEDESQIVPMKRARTARKEDAKDGEDGDEEACQKCGKSDHPEWILLCDNCDKGYHCSCLLPVLFYIPEGDWYCPSCQQEHLILALEQKLKDFDQLVERKILEEREEEKRLTELAEQERLEKERLRKNRKEHKNKRRVHGWQSEGDEDSTGSGDTDNNDTGKSDIATEGHDNEDNTLEQKSLKSSCKADKNKRRRYGGRGSRRAATRSERQRRRRFCKESRGDSFSASSESDSDSESGTGSSSSNTDSEDEPIYKLRKRRQINVTYRLNEFDDLINSALKKEMDEIAGAGNLGRGKDITTIIEADKEEKSRQEHLEADSHRSSLKTLPEEPESEPAEDTIKDIPNSTTSDFDNDKLLQNEGSKSDKETHRKKQKYDMKSSIKKKPRKLTTLDVSSEEDDASDEDFKTSSFDDEEDEDEDTSISASSNSDSSLEVYRRRSKGDKKKQRKAARRAARERRKDRKFVVNESDDDDDDEQHPISKKKRKENSDGTETETGDDEVSEISDNVDSADLCDDTTSEDSDGAWYPSKRKKQRKSASTVANKSPKLIKSSQSKKSKRVEYSDDDISESEEEEEDDEENDKTGGKGSGKQPRSQPLKLDVNIPAANKSGKGKSKKRKNFSNTDSGSDSGDSTRRTRGRRYAYLEDFDDDSSDGGIKPGVKRPDTPPEERAKFIQKQEEIKRMLAEKNSEGAKLVATPRLTPIKGAADKEKRSLAKVTDSLSTVPQSVIRQAKVLDIDYLQRKGETANDLDNVDDVASDFDDADLSYDLPENIDEDAIVRLVEDEEEFSAVASRDLPAPDDVLRTPAKPKYKECEKPLTNPSLAAMSQMPFVSPSGLQEPMRKRLPMPTFHPPLLRHQSQVEASLSAEQIIHRNIDPPTFLLQNALSVPLGQPISRSFPPQRPSMQRMPSLSPPPQLLPARHSLPSSQLLPGNASSSESCDPVEQKPRGRRKKITPLRDPLQKQQTAAAVAAATSRSNIEQQEPKPHQKLHSISSLSGLTPHITTNATTSSRPINIPNTIYTDSDVSRFYGPLHQVLPGARTQSTVGQSPRTPIQIAAMSQHRGIRPTYGLPPPLRGVSGPLHQIPTTANSPGSRVRFPYVGSAQPDLHSANQLGATYGVIPAARHVSAHLNPYRGNLYGSPTYSARGELIGGSVRSSLPAGVEYGTGQRVFSSYGYYPPPPPLTHPHTQSVALPSSSLITSAPSSVIVSVSSAATEQSTSASAGSPVSASASNVNSTTTRDTQSLSKSPSPKLAPNQSKTLREPRKSLTTLEAYPGSVSKSPLAIGEESASCSQSSPALETNAAENSLPPAQRAATPGTIEAVGEGQVGEFSGLVSYFSSQHDDYNT